MTEKDKKENELDKLERELVKSKNYDNSLAILKKIRILEKELYPQQKSMKKVLDYLDEQLGL